MRNLAWLESRGFYAIVDPDHCAGREPLFVARELISAGVRVLQLRTKSLDDNAWLKLARELRAECKRSSTAFVINDRADIAAAADADALHLGQDDLPTDAAAAVVGDMPIGRSTHTLQQARDAFEDNVQYIGFGPIFDTSTKVNPSTTTGIDALRSITAMASVPVVAIGGIDSLRASACYSAGARWIARLAQ